MGRKQLEVGAARHVLAAPKRAPASSPLVGDSASPAALKRLNRAAAELKAQALPPILQQALRAMNSNRHKEAAEVALKALDIDERCGLAWHILAICREHAGDFASSLQCYETALALSPEDPAIANDLGRLAFRLGMKDSAEALFRHFLAHDPNSAEGANNLACALRDQMKFPEAIDTLKTAIAAHPGNAQLWNTLGTVMNECGEMEQGVIFFEEALRLDAKFAKARYNLGNTRLALGDPQAALADCDAAMRLADLDSDRAMMRLARSTILICCGRIGEGWDEYEGRFDPNFSENTFFMVDRPRWTPEADLAGKRLLLMGEQGLGDEVLFANMIPDIQAALGPEGQLTVAIEARLLPLFRRSFPGVEFGAHASYRMDHHTVRGAPFVEDISRIDCWAQMASPLRRFRRTVESFPDRAAFLQADPERVEHWRTVLADAPNGLKVGLVWKSIKLDSGRSRHYSPFALWRDVLATPGVTFVNLQYGDCAAEIEQARREFGVEVWTPPGIDLKNDLDDVAALSCALDVVVGPANATTNIAAACGAPVWLFSSPGAWPRVGTDRYPWYPQARVFTPPAFNRWDVTLAQVAEGLRALV
jgi:tetratricopeptide (TPR) repeat protein